MKKLAYILGGFVAILIIFSALIYFKGVNTIKAGGEEAGQDVIGATVSLSDLSLNPITGVVKIDGFEISQPEGFGNGNSFTIDTFLIDIKPLSLFNETLEIETILLDKPVLNLVLVGADSNFAAMQEKMEQELGQSDSSDAKVILKDFYLNGAVLKVDSEQIGEHQVQLADIHLTNIGVDENGVPPGEVMRLAMDAIKPQIGKLLLELGIKNSLSNGFDQNIGDQLKDQLEIIPDTLKDATDLLKSGIGR